MNGRDRTTLGDWLTRMKVEVETSPLKPQVFATLSYANEKFSSSNIIGDAIRFQRKLSRKSGGAHIQLWSAYGCEVSRGIILPARKHITTIISGDKYINLDWLQECWGWGNIQCEGYENILRGVHYTYEHHHPFGLALECPRRTSSCKRGRCKFKGCNDVAGKPFNLDVGYDTSRLV